MSQKKQARVSKVYQTNEGFKFVAMVDEAKEVIRTSKAQANRARAVLIKAMKADGLKVLCA